MPARPLTLPEREEIPAGIVRGETNVAISDRLGRHRCTISAEIARNGGRGTYRAVRAHDAAAARRLRPKQSLFERHPVLAVHVQTRLEAKDSPLTIPVELAQCVYPEIGLAVSHETIYQAMYDPCDRGLLEDYTNACIAPNGSDAIVGSATAETGGTISHQSDSVLRSLMSRSRSVT